MVRPLRVQRPRAVAPLLLLAGVLLALAAPAWGQDGPTVDIVEVDGVLDRAVAGFVVDAVEDAEERGSAVVVISLNSPGGLGPAAADAVRAVADSDVSVTVWVGPPGARAAGAAADLARAADVLALAPGSTLGPDRPADLAQGPATGEAVTVSTAALEGDVAPAASGTILEEPEIIEAGHADFVAQSLDGVLRELDGRPVAAGTLDVDPGAAQVRFDNMGLVRQVAHALSSPELVYVLLIAGALALGFEVFQPGFGVAGVSGVVVLALAGYGLWILPVAWWALALLAVGFVLLGLDLAVGGLGPVTAAGTAGVGAGSWWLFSQPDALGIPAWLVAFGTATALVFFVGILTVVLRAQGSQAISGAERVVGEIGVVRSMLNPEGHVFVKGGLWRARAPEEAGKVKTGTKVQVTGLNDRLTLDVEVVETPERVNN